MKRSFLVTCMLIGLSTIFIGCISKEVTVSKEINILNNNIEIRL